ncbi:MAG: DUF1080 domain-containing protein [Bryobacterales bacterium]|nr:DUF1080 domain-containing protein [Bryobacterales bacterium]
MLSTAAAAAPPAWETLFDGHSFAGWRSPSGETALEGAWRIDPGGLLTVRPHVQHRTDLWTTRTDYLDFDLEWEWRSTPRANSGIKFWVEKAYTLVVIKEDEDWRKVAKPSEAAPHETTIEYTLGLEYQMAAPDEPTALVKPDARAGAIYGIQAPAVEAVKRAGQWNRSRLIVRADRIEHWLNGRLVLRAPVAGDLARRRRAGPIALQYHQTEVAFRKLRVRRHE